MSNDVARQGRPAGWREAWSRPAFRRDVFLVACLLVAAVAAHSRFLVWNEGRRGVALPDPLLALFEPRDFSTVTFVLVWGGIFGALASMTRTPRRLVLVVQAYAYLVLVRVALMYVVPLDPPATIIPLRDPLVESFSTGQTPLTRDLFFSGHVGTLFLLHLVHARGRVKTVLLVAMAAVAVLTVWQHTHYVVDVLVAPFLAYGCLRLAQLGRAPLIEPAPARAEEAPSASVREASLPTPTDLAGRR